MYAGVTGNREMYTVIETTTISTQVHIMIEQ